MTFLSSLRNLTMRIRHLPMVVLIRARLHMTNRHQDMVNTILGVAITMSLRHLHHVPTHNKRLIFNRRHRHRVHIHQNRIRINFNVQTQQFRCTRNLTRLRLNLVHFPNLTMRRQRIIIRNNRSPITKNRHTLTKHLHLLMRVLKLVMLANHPRNNNHVSRNNHPYLNTHSTRANHRLRHPLRSPLILLISTLQTMRPRHLIRRNRRPNIVTNILHISRNLLRMQPYLNNNIHIRSHIRPNRRPLHIGELLKESKLIPNLIQYHIVIRHNRRLHRRYVVIRIVSLP